MEWEGGMGGSRCKFNLHAWDKLSNIIPDIIYEITKIQLLSLLSYKRKHRCCDFSQEKMGKVYQDTFCNSKSILTISASAEQ